jgi:uncharacterized membrane protein
LEIHLREEIERQMQAGLDGQKAFKIAVQHIGQPESLESEFRKTERTAMKQTFRIGAGIFGLLAGGVLMIPACAQIQQELVVADGKLGLMLLGWVLVMWSVGQLFQLKRPERESTLEIAEMSLVKYSLKSGAGILTLLAGMALVIPAAAQAVLQGLVKFDPLCYFVFGVALLMVGAVITFCPYKKRRA